MLSLLRHGSFATMRVRMASTASSASPSSATQATSELIDRAAQRASKGTRRRSLLSRHSDLIAISIASVVAGSAMMRRREHDEEMSLKNAQLLRVEAERDEALSALSRAEQRLLGGLPGVFADAGGQRGWFSSSEADREGKLRLWISAAFREDDARAVTSSPGPAGSEGTEAMPKMV